MIKDLKDRILYGPRFEMDEVAKALVEAGLEIEIEDLHLLNLFNQDSKMDAENPYTSPASVEGKPMTFHEDNFYDYVRGLEVNGDLNDFTISGEYFVEIAHYRKDESGEWAQGPLLHERFDRRFYRSKTKGLEKEEVA